LGPAISLPDPLALNLDNAANTGALAEVSTSLDLDLDGKTESFSFVPAGIGFLAYDRNNNGRVDNGGELFGPAYRQRLD